MADFNPEDLEKDENFYNGQGEEEGIFYTDFSESDAEERVPQFSLKSREEGFNKLKLVDIEFVVSEPKEDGSVSKYVRLCFQDEEGKERNFNILNPYKGKDVEVVKRQQNRWKHLFGAFIPSPMIEILNKNKRKVKVKKFFHDGIKIDPKAGDPFQQLFEQTRKAFAPDWNQIEVTIVLYFYKRNCNIPLFPAFISSKYNEYKPAELAWNDEWTLVPTGKSNRSKKDGSDTPDTEEDVNI